MHQNVGDRVENQECACEQQAMIQYVFETEQELVLSMSFLVKLQHLVNGAKGQWLVSPSTSNTLDILNVVVPLTAEES